MVVQELIAKLGFDVDQSSLNKADQGLASLVSGAMKAVGAMYLAKQAFDALAWGVMGSISSASAKEDVTTQFKVMLGDLEAAKYLYQEINEYANITSYSTADAAKSVQMMMSSLSAKDAVKNMKMIGDIALGDNERMQGIARAVSQVAAKRKLQGDELMQLRERMFDPLKYLAEMRGVSQQELEAQVQKGKLGIKDLTEAMEYATSQGQKFYKGAEEGGKTWSGMMSTMRDNIRMLGAELGEKLLPTLKAILTAFGTMWDIVAGSFRSMAVAMGIFLEQGPGVISIAGAIAAAFATVADVIMLAMTTFQFFYALLDSIASVAAMVFAGIGDALAGIGKIVALVFRDIFGALGKAGEHLGIKSLEKFGKAQASDIQGKVDGYSFGDFTKGTWLGAAESASEKWGTFRDLGQLIGTTTEGDPAMQMTDRIDKILSGLSAKQPITNITQNNNLTVNAEDPIKTMSESASAKFFQGAFIQIRHATT